MANFTGTSGNDFLQGTGEADTFDLSQGGNDIAFGKDGDDLFLFGATFTIADGAAGGKGFDTLSLAGDYSTQITLGTTLESIEQLVLGPTTTSYNLRFGTPSGNGRWSLSINASALDSSDSLFLNLDGTTAGDSFSIDAGNANVFLTGGDGSLFLLSTGGHVNVSGGPYRDQLQADSIAALDPANFAFDGGGGSKDSLALHQDMSGGVTFQASTMLNVETLTLMSGFSYDLTLNDANIAAGARLAVEAGTIGAVGSFVHLDASGETNGALKVHSGGALNALIKTGAGNDTITAGVLTLTTTVLPGAGHDTVTGNANTDIIDMGGFFDPDDHVDGGSGAADEIRLEGNYAGLKFKPTTFVNIDKITCADGFDYRMTTKDENLATGKTLTVDASALTGNHHIVFNGQVEFGGNFVLLGGAGADQFTGGAKDDDFRGGGGHDDLWLGAGSDDLFYGPASDSMKLKGHDTVHQFDGLNDFIGLGFSVTGSSLVNTGALSKATFEGDLTVALGGLGSHHAIGFTPSTGDLAGHRYLVIDANGVAGYQKGFDLVIEFLTPQHWGTFNFFTE